MLQRTIFFAAGLLATSNAHMFIKSPVPIPGTAPKDPLEGTGSNFPCHGVTLPTTGGEVMKAGSNQTLAFELGENGANTATHGGGSCQISITYETDPTKLKLPSSWKVIYSIEGGCPTDAVGNLESPPYAVACDGTNGPACVNSFPFTIPQGVKDGHAIMSWTWFNCVGNREIYQNCVNVEFSGGDGSEMKSFPDMFVANLQGVEEGECPTTESVNVKFPDPGMYVTTKTEGNPFPLALPTGAGCGGAAAAPSGYASGGQGAGSAPSTTAVPTTSAAPIVISTPVPAPSSTTSTSVAAPTTSAPAYMPPAASSSGSCTDGTVSCPTPGALICVDAIHFGLCDIDLCAIPQAVAPGTQCKNGAIMRKRGLRHMHGRHFAAHHVQEGARA